MVFLLRGQIVSAFDLFVQLINAAAGPPEEAYQRPDPGPQSKRGRYPQNGARDLHTMLRDGCKHQSLPKVFSGVFAQSGVLHDFEGGQYRVYARKYFSDETAGGSAELPRFCRFFGFDEKFDSAAAGAYTAKIVLRGVEFVV